MPQPFVRAVSEAPPHEKAKGAAHDVPGDQDMSKMRRRTEDRFCLDRKRTVAHSAGSMPNVSKNLKLAVL